MQPVWKEESNSLTCHSLSRYIPLSTSRSKFSIQACSLALLHYPILNSTLDPQAETITYKASHNIALAMDTPMGLLVPSIKGVQGLSVFEIAVELNRLQQLGIAGKLSTSDLSGGTFSLRYYIENHVLKYSDNLYPAILAVLEGHMPNL